MDHMSFTKLVEKDQTHGKESPRSILIHKLSRMSVVWNISIGQLGLAPSQLLHTCSLAEHGKLKIALDFFTTAKTITVVSAFLSY